MLFFSIHLFQILLQQKVKYLSSKEFRSIWVLSSKKGFGLFSLIFKSLLLIFFNFSISSFSGLMDFFQLEYFYLPNFHFLKYHNILQKDHNHLQVRFLILYHPKHSIYLQFLHYQRHKQNLKDYLYF